MRSNRSEFYELLEGKGDPNKNLGFDEYLAKISNPTQDAGKFVLYVLASVLQKIIKVYFFNCNPREYLQIFGYDCLDIINVIYSDLLSTNYVYYVALVKNPRVKSRYRLCTTSHQFRQRYRRECMLTRFRLRQSRHCRLMMR